MLERIEKVARVKAVEYDPRRPLERKDDASEERRRKSLFQRTLQNAVRRAEQTNSTVSDAYALDITRATQSLFYQNDFQLPALKLPGALKAYGNG